MLLPLMLSILSNSLPSASPPSPRTSSHLYLVLEYVETTLLEHIESHPSGMPHAQLAPLALQLASALVYMHSIRVRRGSG